MAERVTDWFGTWEVKDNSVRVLIEESPEWIAKQEENSKAAASEISREDMDKAAREIEILNMLMEVGLL